MYNNTPLTLQELADLRESIKYLSAEETSDGKNLINMFLNKETIVTALQIQIGVQNKLFHVFLNHIHDNIGWQLPYSTSFSLNDMASFLFNHEFDYSQDISQLVEHIIYEINKIKLFAAILSGSKITNFSNESNSNRIFIANFIPINTVIIRDISPDNKNLLDNSVFLENALGAFSLKYVEHLIFENTIKKDSPLLLHVLRMLKKSPINRVDVKSVVFDNVEKSVFNKLVGNNTLKVFRT